VQEGWLLALDGLHSARAPVNICLAGLRGEWMGRMEQPFNTSKGCGGVMRVAPVGLDELRRWPGREETANSVEQALALAAEGTPPSPEAIETFGGGWVAEEALAIALYRALAAPTSEAALLLAVNYEGDSDSTGAIAGQLVGAVIAYYGEHDPAEHAAELGS